MVFWLLALIVTAIACAALFYAGAGMRVNSTVKDVDSPELAHLRLQLKEIETDAALGRLGPAEAVAARGEVARELIRVRDGLTPAAASAGPRRTLAGLAIAATAILAFGVYGVMGRPDLPAAPLAGRADLPAPEMSLDDAVARIEAQLEMTPEDLRGWTVIAPAYMQLGRFSDAANALRRTIAIDGATADRETDLGEALMMVADGDPAGEPIALFRSAAARDTQHVRSRYYIAGDLMRTGDLDGARIVWSELLALAKGDEPWLEAARAGLAAASGDVGTMDPAAITGMVEGLAARLASEGGSIEEWTRLVRSRLVLDQGDAAQKAYDAARAAYPDAAVRAELDVLAADHGLVASN